VGEDSAWVAGYTSHGSTIAFSLDAETHAIEQFLRIGDFPFPGIAFDPENQAVWIARAAPASVVRVDLAGGTQ
jgi:hypothetical protein